LDVALDHFISLLCSGIISPDEWSERAESVIVEVLRWGEGVARVAESN